MMTLIQTVTVASAQASINFASIPATFTDLFLVAGTRDNNNVNGYPMCNANLTLNGDAANYTARILLGQGSGSGSSGTYSVIPNWHPTSLSTANTFGSASFYIPNYAGSTYKSVSVDTVLETNGGFTYTAIVAGRWDSTAAVNQLTLTAEGLFAPGSTASLYGITKGSGGATVSP